MEEGIKFEFDSNEDLHGLRVTQVYIQVPWFVGRIYGNAVCSPKDTDVKVLGQKAAVTNALKGSVDFLDKDKRTEVWKAFFNRSKASRKIVSL